MSMAEEIWVSLSDAAELESVPYETMRSRIRFNSDSLKVKNITKEDGGKALVYIALSSLSAGAQERYKQREYDKIRRERARKATADKEPPWYTAVDIGWYISEYKKEHMEKTALAGELEKYLEQKELHRKEVTGFCEEFAKQHLGMSGKQMRRYLQRYNEGAEWARLAEEQDGQNYRYYRILALCTPPKKGTHTKLTPEIMAMIENLCQCQSKNARKRRRNFACF